MRIAEIAIAVIVLNLIAFGIMVYAVVNDSFILAVLDVCIWILGMIKIDSLSKRDG